SAGHSGIDSASDASSYFGVDPQIAINKVTVDGATSGDGLNILTGESIGWRYTVTNVGNVALSNVSVTDNQSGVTPVLQSGDTNNNSKLDLGETWVYTANGTAVIGSYSNTGTASSSYSDSAGHSRSDSTSDGSSYFGVDPQIAINKVTVDGATSGDGLNILTGESIGWRYTVTNVGNVALSNVSVTDNQSGVSPVLQSGDTNNNSKLDLGETWVYAAAGTAITGSYSNTGTASGSYTDSAGHSRSDSASDGSSYFGVDPEIAINKVTVDGATSGDGLNILTGESIGWRYTVTNVGNVALSSVSVTDNQPGVTPALQSGDTNNNSKLDLGETWVYAAAGTAITGSYSNTGTASGSYSDSAGHSRTDSANDGSSYFGVDPQIAINKVTVNGANSGDGLTIPVGAPITWRYTVTNVGNVALSNVSVTDNKPGVTPVLQSGDTNNNAKLDLGETWIYTAAGTAVSGNYSNIGTANGSYIDSAGHSRSDTATDGSSYYGAMPQIAINKVTVDGATSGDGLNILTGEAITWRYTVTNLGNVSVSNIAVTDNQPGVTPVFQSGDTNNNSKLDLGETWVYTANGTAITGNYSNLGTVSGTDTTGASVQASDSSSYFGVDPEIAVNKVTVDGATSGDGLNILTGESIGWRYTVTNVGNVALSNVSVTDNQPGVSPVFQSGDTNNNAKLDLGETWVYAANGTAIIGNYSNTGTASGKFTDSAGHSRTDSASDGSSYFGVDPEIAINKVTVDGATSGDGLNILTGESIGWRYTVTNVGNIALSNVSVTDNQPGVTPVLQSGDTNNNGLLDLSETWVYAANGTAITGNYSNTGTASGKFIDSSGHSRTDSASDGSSYFGVDPQIAINKVTVDGATSGDGLNILTGDAISWRYTVTNVGNVALSNVSVTDNQAGVTPVLQSGDTNNNSKLDLGETWVYAAAGTAITGNYSNTGTASGSYTDVSGHSRTDSASDGSSYFGVDPEIAINKVTVDGATSGDGLNILTGESIGWRYTVTNVGNVALSNVSVTDNKPGVSPVYQSGDTNNNAKLDLGETWVYAANGTAITGNYSNTGTASGKFTDSSGHSRTASASDGSSYFGVDPQIAINKVTVDGGTSGDGLNIHAGEAISWRYTVTNVGNIALCNVSVTDNQPGVTPVLQSGDTNNNSKLDLGETWVYTANGTAVTGNYSNTGTASGKFTDSNGHSRTDTATDASSYFGAVPQIAVKDQVSVDNGVTWLDADVATGPTALAGSPVKFRVIVTNTGNVALSNVNVSDTAFAFTGVVTSLAVGASDVSDIYTTSATVGQHEDTATARGTFSDSAGHARTASSSDQAHYVGRRDTIVIAPDKQNTSTSLVKVVDKNTGAIVSQFYAYEPNFTGGVRVATGDMNGDGIDEIITAPGRGRAPEIRVFTQDGVELTQFRTMAYANTYVGGVQVDVGDVNGDGKNDIVVAPSTGATQVRIFYNNYNPANPNADPIADTPSKQFNVYSSSFLGGADIAVADMGKFSNGATLSATTPDGKAEVIVGNGPGMRSTVYVYDVSGTPTVVDTILPLSNTYSGGITLDAGRVNADAIPDLIVAGGNAGGSTVEVWSGIVNDVTDVKLASFTTFANTTTPNMPVHATWIDSNGDGIVDSIVAVQGTDGTSNQIRSFGSNGALQNTLNGFTGSWNIAAIHHAAGATAAPATTLAAPLSAASLVTTTQTSPPTTTAVATSPVSTPLASPAPQPTVVAQPTIVSAQTTVKKTVSAQAADAIYSTLGSTLTH
ncbi:MAG TPA: VCBS repeat-containing protein, partial [Pirellulales bacterium]|nr:VCBS repeat-containing protein [Pirellulales bacterium]